MARASNLKIAGGAWFLLEFEQWTEEVAYFLAQKADIELTDGHWEVIRFLRDYYEKHRLAPIIKLFVQEFGRVAGLEKGNTKYLYGLFPGGPANQGCMIAGLPKPAG